MLRGQKGPVWFIVGWLVVCAILALIVGSALMLNQYL